MTIRKVITSAAIAAFLGLAGGSAYAQDIDSHIVGGFTATADANHPGTVFGYNVDSDINEGDALSTDAIEKASLPENVQDFE